MSSTAGRLIVTVNDARFLLTHRMPLVDGARAAGYDVMVAAPAPISESIARAVEEIRERGFPVEFVPFRSQRLNPFAEAAGVWGIARLYRRLRPQIVHHVTIKPVLYGTVAARMVGVPCVVNAISGLGTLFGTSGGWTKVTSRLARAAYGFALRHPNSRTIFQNADDQAAFLAAGIVRREEALLIPGSGVDLDEFTPMPEPGGIPTVVLTARLLRQKGIYEFAAAAERLKNDGVQARFALVGDQASNRDAVPAAHLQRWADRGIVELWGWQTDMRKVLEQTTIFCLPSYYREGVPKALLEASAAARPIVTTDMPGCRDVVSDGVNGLIVPPRDIDALAMALRRLIEDPDTRRRFGLAARARAEERFSADRVVGETLDAYAELRARRNTN
jgi:glycosyltransferase involved in cell wall biosynthesis